MKIAIAGASGLVGSALIPILQSDGNQITRLVRSSPKPGEIEWHPNQDAVSAASLEGFETIINSELEPAAATFAYSDLCRAALLSRWSSISGSWTTFAASCHVAMS